MGYVGVSLVLASVVWVLFRPPPFLYPYLRNLQHLALGLGHDRPRAVDKAPPSPPDISVREVGRNAQPDDTAVPLTPRIELASSPSSQSPPPAIQDASQKAALDRASMPPPPPPTIQVASARTDEVKSASDRAMMPPPPLPSIPRKQSQDESEDQSTPKAAPTLNVPDEPIPPLASPLPQPLLNIPSSTDSPRRTPAGRIPNLAPFPALNSQQRALPVPNRGPRNPSSSLSPSSSLVPPPSHSSKPTRPSRKVTLTPGHSPLDWADLTRDPSTNLRGLSPDTPYLRVTPSMLRRQTGRKGKDAWLALSGRVYNISPYLPFHPGGVPEALRGAGRDATKLFGEVHPWVNYENMLSACLVGILVDEHDPRANAMEEMD